MSAPLLAEVYCEANDLMVPSQASHLNTPSTSSRPQGSTTPSSSHHVVTPMLETGPSFDAGKPRRGKPRAAELSELSKRSWMSESNGTRASSTTSRGVQSQFLAVSSNPTISSCDSKCPEVDAAVDSIFQLGFTQGFIIKVSDLKVGSEILGCGGYGIIKTAQYQGAEVALKIARTSGSQGPQVLKSIRSLETEIRFLCQVRHPNIVRFIGVCLDRSVGGLAIICERIEGLELNRYVADVVRMNVASGTRIRRSLVFDVACGLQYLHAQSPPIVHGDIKPQNVMVNDNRRRPVARLLDFGLARFARIGERRMGGTAAWAAPEVWRGDAVPACSADVYSYGLLAYNTMTRKKANPHKGPHRCDVVLDMNCCKAMFEDCLRYDPAKRPSMIEVARRLMAWSVESAEDSQSEGSLPELSPASEGCPSPHACLILRATSMDSKRTAVLQFLARWKVADKRVHCCVGHAVLKELRVAIKTLEIQAPLDISSFEMRWQCPDCGILSQCADSDASVDQHCDVCQHRRECADMPAHVDTNWHSRFRETTVSTRKASVLALLLSRWHYDIHGESDGSWCKGAIKDCNMIAKLLSEETCETLDHQALSAKWQCTGCGILHREQAHICSLCCQERPKPHKKPPLLISL